MSYTVLARRYRSTTFDEVIGQEHVAQTLKKAIESDRIAHAYLFTGTRGVGKTSMARIMAKALNCHAADGPTPTPCGKCESCQHVAKGDDMDVIEIDAASNTGVDNVRDIIENAQYRPANSRFKVYIIDEVHMLSKAAFNALLKTMEEPPSHVKFILATTEVEKVLPTILSRCQRYDFRNIPTREIAGHLKDICKQEKIAAGEDALMLVAKAGAGSMRDALSLLDRLLSVGEKKLTTDLIESMLGLPRSQQLFDLAQAIGDGDIKSALTRATAMINAGQSVDSLIAALTDHLRNLLILRTCGADSELVEVPGLSLNDMVAQAERFDPAALVQDVTILEELRRHVRQSQAGRALLDATIVRMAMAEQFASIGELMSQMQGGGSESAARKPAMPAQKKKTDELTGNPSAPSSAFAAAVATIKAQVQDVASGASDVSGVSLAFSTPGAAPPGRAEAVTPSISTPTPSTAPSTGSVLDNIDFGDDDLPQPGRVWEADAGPSLSEMVKSGASTGASVGVAASAATAPPEVSSVATLDNDLEGAWSAMLESLKPQVGIYGVISQFRLDRLDADGVAVLAVPARHDSFARMWEKNGKKDVIREALGRAIGRGIGIRFEVETDPDAAAPGAAPATSPGGPAVADRAAPTSRPSFPGQGAPARSTPTPGGPAQFAPNQRGGNRPAERPSPPPPPPAQRVTQEQADAIRAQSPLVAALAATLNAQIVKIE